MIWIPYDTDNRDAHPLPKFRELVWVYDEFYDGVTIGWRQHWSGEAWAWYTLDRKDDCGITSWMPLDKPNSPVEESTVHTTDARTVGEMITYLQGINQDTRLIEVVPEEEQRADGTVVLTGRMRLVTRR